MKRLAERETPLVGVLKRWDACLLRWVSILPAAFNIGQPIGYRLEHLLSRVGVAIAVMLYGNGLDTLRELAE